ncbi:MAG: Gfo/Idh/MocA family oxidoreductase [Lentisphaerae bacterium]|nr:Gfo/Idh/MocA family oxidoreductase [Lentisphaerota bacterium]
MNTVRIGMLGAGQVAAGNCRQILEHPLAEIVAVADPNETRARALAKEFGIARRYASAEALCADPDVDAVSNSVPNAFHAPTAVAALEAGKHVLLDKPFARTLREAQKIADTARRAGKILVVGMNQRFAPGSQVVKGLVARGDLGDVYHARAYWLRRSGIPRLGTWFGRKALSGGGVMLDIGVHMLDLSLYLMDNFRPVAVSAVTHSVFGHRGLGGGKWGMSEPTERVFDVEDFAAALVHLRGGASVVLEVAWAMHQEEPNRHNVELFGSEAGAAVFPEARLFRYGRKPGDYEVRVPRDVEGPCSGQNRFTNWIDAILDRARPACTIREALTVQRILDAVYASARTRKEVRLT